MHSHAAAADCEHDNAATRAHEVSEQWAKDQRRRRAVHGNSRNGHDALESTRTGGHTVVSSQWDRCRTGGPGQCIVYQHSQEDTTGQAESRHSTVHMNVQINVLSERVVGSSNVSILKITHRNSDTERGGLPQLVWPPPDHRGLWSA